jgi:NitT/TauT family transport system ATP-binding protein
MLQVRDVCKTFAGERGREALEVLRNIRFEAAAGEFVAIIGPSGCGKTTLLRMLHGLEPASSGAILVSGKRVTRPSKASAMVFQQFNLFPSMPSMPCRRWRWCRWSLSGSAWDSRPRCS